MTKNFWLNDVLLEKAMFKGVIANEPGLVGNVQMGESWSIGREEISDWMFTQRRMIHEGFTITPLLDSIPEKEAEAMRVTLVQ